MYYLFTYDDYDAPSSLKDVYHGVYATPEDAYRGARVAVGGWAELWTITDGELTLYATHRQFIESIGELRRIIRNGWQVGDEFREMGREYQQRTENPTLPTIALDWRGIEISEPMRMRVTGVWMPAYHWITVEPWE